MTYKGVTSPIEVLYDKLNADNHQYFDGGKLLPGAVVSGIAKDNGIGHMWFYMGEFKNRDAVLDYLVKLGYKRDSVSKYVGSQRDAGPMPRQRAFGSVTKFRAVFWKLYEKVCREIARRGHAPAVLPSTECTATRPARPKSER